MTHTVYIWKRSKKTGNYYIGAKIKITDSDIEALALSKFDADNTAEHDMYEFEARIEETVI